jgi:hypothetical protein
MGHDNERFAVRPGVKGECADKIVPETVPQIDAARELIRAGRGVSLSQRIRACDASGFTKPQLARRVYHSMRGLVDPFTSDEVLWEFENLFVLSGQTKGHWQGVSTRFLQFKNGESNENRRQNHFG